jgi:hypothetical protein
VFALGSLLEGLKLCLSRLCWRSLDVAS